MMELFSKQGVSVPITTQMVWEAYGHVRQGGEAAGIDGMTWAYLHTHRSQLFISVVGAPCIRKLFSKSHQGCQHS